MPANQATVRVLEHTVKEPARCDTQASGPSTQSASTVMTQAKALTNQQSLELTINMLVKNGDRSRRWFAAKTLGDLARTKAEPVKSRVLSILGDIAENDEDPEVRDIAQRSVREINGEFDSTSEKYNPQEPVGSLSEQYYLKRG